jgi:hypothetical protein
MFPVRNSFRTHRPACGTVSTDDSTVEPSRRQRMPRPDAPRVRVVLTAEQRRARVRTLAYVAAVSGIAALAVVVLVLAAGSGRTRWLALAALLPTVVAVAAARAAVVLNRLRPEVTGCQPSSVSNRPRRPPSGRLPVNLGRTEATAGSPPERAG